MSNLSNFGSQVCTKYIFAVSVHCKKQINHKKMANITPTTPSFIFGYWRPWKEDSKYFDSYLDYSKDVSLARYQADCVGQYISQASSEQVEAIGELGQKLGIEIKNASERQVQAIDELGNKFEKGINVLSHQMSNINEELSFVNKNISIQIEQQKITNLLLENVCELLRVPDSEKERQHCIELGLKFFVNAQNDEDLFSDSLEELLRAEQMMRQDYFVLHRIGLIYLYAKSHINPSKALDYFTRAAKYASVETDPKAARLANVLAQYGNHVNTEISNNTNAIQSLAADSYEKAAFANYILGDFESAVKFQSKAVKFNGCSENYFMLAKYQARTKQIDLCVQNISLSIDLVPEIVTAIFKELDLVNEPEVLNVIEKYIEINKIKNDVINNKIIQLKNELTASNSYSAKKAIAELENALSTNYNNRVKIFNISKVVDINNWTTTNLDVNTFRNGDIIPEVYSADDWIKAGIEKRPAWCYYNNDPEYGKNNGRLYNWYAVTDPRCLAPKGWHIPSINEWNKLIDFLGGSEEAAKKMKSTNGWGIGYEGENSSGFAAIPCGSRSGRLDNGKFSFLEKCAVWWTIDERHDDKFGARGGWIGFIHNGCSQGDNDVGDGMPVRLVRD